MKALSLFAFLFVSTGWTQSAPPAAPPAEQGDTVIAIFEDGGKLTLDEYKGLINIHPSWQNRSREEVIRGYAILRKAANIAQQKKLNEKSPYREILDFQIMYNMADFAVKDAAGSSTVQQPEIEKYYNEHKDIYRQVKVSGLKINFGDSPSSAGSAPPLASKPPKKTLTEQEAKAKGDKLVAQLRAGADFRRMVQAESDDEATKAKGGEIGIVRMTDNLPDLMRATILSMKEGDFSEPIQQGGYFYIFHADAVTYAPLVEVRDSIFNQLQQDHANQWMQELDKNTKVTFPSPAPPAKK